ncbi:MAG TPA: hypothetical protein VHB21_08330 [Minicystis sp.]|nr:hypothetical protein [Minicystis sp.]
MSGAAPARRRPASRAPLYAAVAGVAALTLWGCPFPGTSSTGSGGAGGSTGVGGATSTSTGPATPRWYASCAVPGCPDVPPQSLPCNADEVQGAPCAYVGATCDARLACGAELICTTADPKSTGCF